MGGWKFNPSTHWSYLCVASRLGSPSRGATVHIISIGGWNWLPSAHWYNDKDITARNIRSRPWHLGIFDSVWMAPNQAIYTEMMLWRTLPKDKVRSTVFIRTFWSGWLQTKPYVLIWYDVACLLARYVVLLSIFYFVSHKHPNLWMLMRYKVTEREETKKRPTTQVWSSMLLSPIEKAANTIKNSLLKNICSM